MLLALPGLRSRGCWGGGELSVARGAAAAGAGPRGIGDVAASGMRGETFCSERGDWRKLCGLRCSRGRVSAAEAGPQLPVRGNENPPFGLRGLSAELN